MVSKPLSLLIVCLIIAALLGFDIIHGCPDYPIPIELDQSDVRLQNAYLLVDQMIQKQMSANGIKSFVASIVYRDEMVWSKTYGVQNPLNDTSPPLTIDSHIAVASVTKVFTDLMMFQMRDRGLIQSLDDPVTDYIKEFSILDPYKQSRKITLRELSSHQSGLPRELPCAGLGSQCTEEMILSMLSKMFLVLPQYSVTHYSNLGISMLGHALARAASQPYHTYVKKNILEPLDMHNSTFSFKQALPTLAIGLTLLPNGSYIETPPPPIGWAGPAGGLFATTRDMSKFIAFWLSTDDYNDFGIINTYQDQDKEKKDKKEKKEKKEKKSSKQQNKEVKEMVVLKNNTTPKVLASSTINEALSAINLVNDGESAYGTPFEMYYDQTNQVWLKGKHGVHVGVRSQILLAKQYKLGLFFSAMLNLNTPDVFTQAAMDILLPVYQTLLLEQQSPLQQNQLKQQKQHTTNDDPRELYVGVYGLSGLPMFVVWIDQSTNQLMATGFSLPKFNVSKFLDEYPLVLRIEISQPSKYICKDVVDGYNYELIYFTLDENNSTQCSSLLFMGQLMTLQSKKNTKHLVENGFDYTKLTEQQQSEKYIQPQQHQQHGYNSNHNHVKKDQIYNQWLNNININ
ncbi:hypothetical protein DFA_08820 [Cavenderia fasciculata]|uniref:Beta-lactamase-related domain-containing protein n=1 Tax=Cavenderia fasciculata TaxID=261658 RepID=F4Q4H0_CACFS|nr:uncharacterized protein DFA_08820 [Cavenderia fasciculata]EGG17819.1 hypothetical protein DFA_08820 [Cavenderia fasciculata]|eukprot:XP_004356303.1 hypothetical protein DFA_08820 [Cavenderia fasciculata]